MDGATIITTARGDWTALAARPTGWSIRRLECHDHSVTYLTWDPSALRCGIFLNVPPAQITDQLHDAGFTPLPTDQLTRTQVWTIPADSAALAAAA
ncbi:MAG: hypothetical protein OEO17_10525 [Gemmatimonadota bacterium]|nr:hypothetical protein [Gemmatimonadota bacterium]MDH5614910.1 hypothetical protein [Acidimicrobiia bacterium]